MKIKQNTWFWILQISGWGLLFGTQILVKLQFNKDLNNSYIIVEGLFVFLLGVFISTGLRYVLRKSINKKTQKINFLKVFIAYIIFSLIFSLTLFIAIPLYNYYHTESFELTQISIISNIANSFFFFFIWLLFYYIIKLVFKENHNNAERLKLKTTLKESQLNTLKGQINPHFMFNSLNNIRGLMLEDVEKSRDMITRLSEMLRYSLTKNSLDKITLSEELEMVDNYTELSKIQLENRLTFTKEIDNDVLNAEIPPMLIQMLVENAIKHGISNLPNGGKVVLTIKKEKNNLVIKVKNSGKLVINKTSTKVGLQNIEKRLSLMYGENANFSLKEVEENVIARIVIPCKKTLDA